MGLSGREVSMLNSRLWISLCILVVPLAACSVNYPKTCPSGTPVGLMDSDEITRNKALPYRFPLDESTNDYSNFFGWFGVSNECPPNMTDCHKFPVRQFHAAEDYRRPAGTPVYSMADGRISFSGPAGGYGWLVTIDHPQANLYSLYGHLSPSRWKLETGTEVQRGELIAYLGDSDENGGSEETPLEPHLHFGIRAGQTADYPARGEWRYMAGWVRLCPQDLGWLQPSVVIASQETPAGGYPQPKVEFLTRWGFELLITAIYSVCAIGMLIYGVRRKYRFLLLFPGILVVTAGIIFHNNGMMGSYTLVFIGILILVVGVYFLTKRSI